MALRLTDWEDGNPTQPNDSEGSNDETEPKPETPYDSSQNSSQRIFRKQNMMHVKVLPYTLIVVALLITVVIMVAVLIHNQQGRPGVHEAAPANNVTKRTRNSTGSTATEGLQKPQTIQWIQLALDILRVPNCGQEFERAGLPCRNKTAYITPESLDLRPLRCVDDAHHENRTRHQNSCAADSDTFQLLGDLGRVRVRQAGIFLLIAQITVRMAEAAQVHFGLAVNKDHLAFLCTVQSYGVLREGGSIPYSYCSVKGLRHLSPGDEVSLFVSQGGVPLQSLYRSTFLQMALLGDGRMPS